MANITPTVGRIVYFHPAGADTNADGYQPHAATVAFVHADGSTVNLRVVDHDGGAYPRRDVPLVQDGETAPGGHWCEWMPYQKGQAAKVDETGPRIAMLEYQIASVISHLNTLADQAPALAARLAALEAEESDTEAKLAAHVAAETKPSVAAAPTPAPAPAPEPAPAPPAAPQPASGPAPAPTPAS